MTKKIYVVLEGSRVLRMSFDKNAMIRYRDSFAVAIRKALTLAEKVGSSSFVVSRERR